MSYVIAVCGAGGKTGRILSRAGEYAAGGGTVWITTTTHIGIAETWKKMEALSNPEASFFSVPLSGEESEERNACKSTDCKGAIYVCGCPASGGKLSYPGDEIYERICREADYVLVEADGSRHLPLKLPREGEPVIPENADEIEVVMGLCALGRRFGTVCHRAELYADYFGADASILDRTVDRALFSELLERAYLKPLREAFPEKKLSLFTEDWRRAPLKRRRKPALILLASGKGERFGSNKLLAELEGVPLYLNTLKRLLEAARLLMERMSADEKLQMPELFVLSRYDELLFGTERFGSASVLPVHAVFNPDYAEGIAGSIRNGAHAAKEAGCTDYVYFAADMPYLPAEDIADYIDSYLHARADCAVMCSGTLLSNPGILSERYYDGLMTLSGESGAMKLLRQHAHSCYYYPVEAEKLRDIDRREDLPPR